MDISDSSCSCSRYFHFHWWWWWWWWWWHRSVTGQEWWSVLCHLWLNLEFIFHPGQEIHGNTAVRSGVSLQVTQCCAHQVSSSHFEIEICSTKLAITNLKFVHSIQWIILCYFDDRFHVWRQHGVVWSSDTGISWTPVTGEQWWGETLSWAELSWAVISECQCVSDGQVNTVSPALTLTVKTSPQSFIIILSVGN